MIELKPLLPSDTEQFIADNQEAFNYGALQEFGIRYEHFEEDGQIISRTTIEQSIEGGEAYRIMKDGKPVGGLILKVNGDHGDLEILFVSPKEHSKGIGYEAWCEVEKRHPEVKVWETVTPYFEERNIHFYVNRCGFHIVEFFNSHHPDPNEPEMTEHDDGQFPDGMFRFEKMMAGTENRRRLVILALFTFFIAPLAAWLSILASEDNAVFASLSRMIWFSGSEMHIFIAMLILFVPMITAFFFAHNLMGLEKRQKALCRVFMVLSCAVLYVGAMWIMPSNGTSMTAENVWHGVLSFGGMLMIFLTYCMYTVMIGRKDRDGAGLLVSFLVFSLVSSAFAVLNVFDEKSYVIASAVSELYVLTMMSLTGYLTYYLAYRHAL